MAQITPVSITLSKLALGSCTSENPSALRNSGTIRFLGIGSLLLSFRSSQGSSLDLHSWGQVVSVMGLSFGYNLAEESQLNVRVAERCTLDVERSIKLKACQ